LDGDAKDYVSVIESWIKSWFTYIESEAEYEKSKELLLQFFHSPPPGITEANILHITTWITRTMENQKSKWLFSSFLYKRTYQRQSTQFVEAENSSLKRSTCGTRPSQSIDESAIAQVDLCKLRNARKRKACATQLDQVEVESEFLDINQPINKFGTEHSFSV
jgi:hypothetical protein